MFIITQIMNIRIWKAYRRSLSLARNNLSGSDRAISMLKYRNAIRLEYLRYANTSNADDIEQLIECHEKINTFLEWWWASWEDPIEKPSFKTDWKNETRFMGEEEAKKHYASLLKKRVEGLREFNQQVDQLLQSRPAVPTSEWQNPEPEWKVP